MTRKHRVVVQIDDDEDRPEDIKRSPVGMEVLDSCTLQTRNLRESRESLSSTRQFNFDCVGTSRNAFTRAEMTMLMDQLLLQQSNCSLIRFSPQHQCPLAFLCNLLVTEVDKRMLLLQTKLVQIKVEYYDVRKYDVVNLLGQMDKHTTVKSKRAERPHLIFNSTLELLKWLQGKYLQLFSIGHGHENLDIQYIYSSARNHTYEAKLSLIMMYLSKMDADTRTCLRNFLENINNKKKLKNLMLTDCLKEILTGADNWYSWFLFNVPTATGVGTTIDDMLKLANAAYTGVNAMYRGDEVKESSSINLDLDSIMSLPMLTNHNRSMDSVSSMPPRSHLSMANDINKSPTVLNPKRTTTTNRYPLKDLSDINYWYSKTDDRVASAIKHMEAYYTCKYRAKIAKMCYEIKCMMRPKNAPCEPLATYSSDEVQTHYNNYKSAVLQFTRLVNEIQRTMYADLLKVYLKTKHAELKQYAVLFKLRHLEACQSCITETIKGETTLLNGRVSLSPQRSLPGSSRQVVGAPAAEVTAQKPQARPVADRANTQSAQPSSALTKQDSSKLAFGIKVATERASAMAAAAKSSRRSRLSMSSSKSNAVDTKVQSR